MRSQGQSRWDILLWVGIEAGTNNFSTSISKEGSGFDVPWSETFVLMLKLSQWISNSGNQTVKPGSVRRAARGWEQGDSIRTLMSDIE